jgi:purine-binding chemotaxis protein CheW
MAGPDTSDAGERRRALLAELHANEHALVRIRAGLAALGPGAPLPGLHLVAKVSGETLLVPGTRIAEVASLVACEPIPGSAAWVLGGFVWRGRPAIAVDLGRRLGGASSASLDAMMVILDGAPTVALVVDALGALAEDLVLAEHDAEKEGGAVWAGSCRLGEEALPLLAPEALEREARGLGLERQLEVCT